MKKRKQDKMGFVLKRLDGDLVGVVKGTTAAKLILLSFWDNEKSESLKFVKLTHQDDFMDTFLIKKKRKP